MVDFLLGLMAFVLLETAVLAGIAIRASLAGRRKDSSEREQENTANEDFEKRWQEGIDAMMGYDVTRARRAAGRDENET